MTYPFRHLSLPTGAKHVDYVPEEDLLPLYNGAKAFIYPSVYEGFGLPVLEAMACGTPVITSNLSSLPEVAGDAALLVDPYSVLEIAEALFLVAEDDGLRYTMRQKGVDRANEFSWERCARETLSVLEAAAKGDLPE